MPYQQKLYASDVDSAQKRSLFVSVVVPAYNEASFLADHLLQIYNYLQDKRDRYRWELVVVNDGSADETGVIAETFAKGREGIVVLHHPYNQGLGQALRTGFAHASGDYVITLDVDLSYALYHIDRLLNQILASHAQIVVASPYMPGGEVSNVPFVRRWLSAGANRFLSFMTRRTVSTSTGMVRVYDRKFLQGIHLKSTAMDMNAEILLKAKLLGAKVDEIPAHLHWSDERAQSASLSPSSMKIFRQTWAIAFYGFLFRPVLFFILPGLILFALSLYADSWAMIHCWENYHKLSLIAPFPDPTLAVAQAFKQAPHTFIIGGITLMLAIQLFSLGILSVQSKSYFEEIFYLVSAIYRQNVETQSKD
jgi:glycosyltransferase involved in cell wall biosynthesis